MWEFPGGKREPGETLEASLVREIQEELGATRSCDELLLTARHDYETREVELHFFACDLTSEPQPRLGQEIRWVTPAEIGTLEFPPADAELIELLKQGDAQRQRQRVTTASTPPPGWPMVMCVPGSADSR